MGEEAGAAAPSPCGRLGMLSCRTAPFLLQMGVGNELVKSAWPPGSYISKRWCPGLRYLIRGDFHFGSWQAVITSCQS